MSDILDFFPSNYVKADDLEDGKATVTIDQFVVESIDGKEKPIITFTSDSGFKPLVLNKTNATRIRGLYGGDYNDWRGKELELYKDFVSYKGQSVPCVRVRMP